MQSSGFIHQSASPFHSSATQKRQAAYYSLATAGLYLECGEIGLGSYILFPGVWISWTSFFVVVVPFLSPLLILHSVDSLDDVLFLALSLFFTTRLQ